MRQALTQLEDVLRRCGHAYQANLAGIARETWSRDPQAACRVINSPEWWEDADAVAAIDPAVDGGFTVAARRDAHDFRLALIEVFTTLRAYGEHNATGEIIVSQFQKWMESRI